MAKVRLYGQLADRFGSEFDLDIATPSEAIAAINANHPGFRKTILDLHRQGIVYRVMVGDRVIDEEQLTLPSGRQEIRIYPIASGSGNVGRIIAGIGLVGLGISGVGLLGLSAGSVAMLGGTVALGGVVGLFGVNKTPDEKSTDEPNSLIYSGATETEAQGSRVPIILGTCIVKGTIISASVRSYQTILEDQDD